MVVDPTHEVASAVPGAMLGQEIEGEVVGAMSTVEAQDKASGSDRPSRRRTVEGWWVAGVVLFVIIRFVLAYSVLADQAQLVVIVFGLIDIGTAVPYAIGTARLVTSLVDRRPQTAARWGALASASFLAPYLWLAWAGRDGSFPTIVYVVTGLFVVCVGANAVLGIRRRVHSQRALAAVSQAGAIGSESAPWQD